MLTTVTDIRRSREEKPLRASRDKEYSLSPSLSSRLGTPSTSTTNTDTKTNANTLRPTRHPSLVTRYLLQISRRAASPTVITCYSTTHKIRRRHRLPRRFPDWTQWLRDGQEYLTLDRCAAATTCFAMHGDRRPSFRARRRVLPKGPRF